MARDKEKIKRRNKEIIADYNNWSKMAKYRGKETLLYNKLDDKYFLSNRTFDEILSGRAANVKPKIDPNQTSIFDNNEV